MILKFLVLNITVSKLAKRHWTELKWAADSPTETGFPARFPLGDRRARVCTCTCRAAHGVCAPQACAGTGVTEVCAVPHGGCGLGRASRELCGLRPGSPCGMYSISVHCPGLDTRPTACGPVPGLHSGQVPTRSWGQARGSKGRSLREQPWAQEVSSPSHSQPPPLRVGVGGRAWRGRGASAHRAPAGHTSLYNATHSIRWCTARHGQMFGT